MKRFVLELCLSGIGLLLIYLAIFLPSLMEYRTRIETVKESNSSLPETLPVLLRAGQVEKDLKKLQVELEKRERRIKQQVEGGEVATLLRETVHRMDLRIVSEMPWVTSTKNSTEEESPSWKGSYMELQKKIILEGDYFSAGRFLEEVERIDSLARSTRVSLKKKTNDDEALRIEVTISVYDLHQLQID